MIHYSFLSTALIGERWDQKLSYVKVLLRFHYSFFFFTLLKRFELSYVPFRQELAELRITLFFFFFNHLPSNRISI